MRAYISMAALAWLLLSPAPARCWGEEGHQIVGLIALHYLTPKARTQVTALLAGDSSGLTPSTGIADESDWADKFRDSDRNTTRVHYRQTRDWHFIDVEIDRPDWDAACFGHPALPPGGTASEGPAADCVVDKIDQFRGELESAATATDERRLALQFLLHLVGDLHQPLHAADDHDRGGNDIRVVAVGSAAGNLHHYWDTVFVARLGADPGEVAESLIAGIADPQRRSFSSGSPTDWARESFAIAKSQVYGKLPRAGTGRARGALRLDDDYSANAGAVVALQLQRAGVRLASLLNEACP